MIDGNIGRLEGDSVQAPRQTKYCVYAVLKTEIGLEFLIGQVILGNTLFLGVVAEVPGTDLITVKTYAAGKLIEFCNLILGLGQGGGAELLDELPSRAAS